MVINHNHSILDRDGMPGAVFFLNAKINNIFFYFDITMLKLLFKKKFKKHAETSNNQTFVSLCLGRWAKIRFFCFNFFLCF